MKKIIIALVALSSLSVFAHPKDSNRVSDIGIGSRILIENDINIAPNAKEVRFNSVKLNSLRQEVAVCDLVMKKSENYDRVITRGDILEVTSTEGKIIVADSWTNRRGTTTWYKMVDNLKVNNQSIDKITCFMTLTSPYVEHLEPVTIIQLKNSLKGNASIELAEPVKI